MQCRRGQTHRRLKSIAADLCGFVGVGDVDKSYRRAARIREPDAYQFGVADGEKFACKAARIDRACDLGRSRLGEIDYLCLVAAAFDYIGVLADEFDAFGAALAHSLNTADILHLVVKDIEINGAVVRRRDMQQIVLLIDREPLEHGAFQRIGAGELDARAADGESVDLGEILVFGAFIG